jgi:predicted ATPase
LARALDHPYSEVIAMTYAAVQYHFTDDVANCLAQATTATALAGKYGFTLWYSMANFLRGWALARTGGSEGFEQGFSAMQASVESFRSTGAELGAAYFAALLGQTLAQAGQLDVGLLAVGQALDLLERTQDHWCAAELYRIQGELIWQYGDTQEAESALQNALSTAHSQSARWWVARAEASLARFYGQPE